MGVCKYGFCNVWACVSMGFVMRGCVYVGFLMCGCFGNICTCIYCVLYCFVYVYLLLFITNIRTTATE